MKTKYLSPLILALVSLVTLGLSTGCREKETVKDDLKITPTEVTFEATGGTQVLEVETNVAQVETLLEADWLKAVYAEKKITLTASANETTEQRVATLKVKVGTAAKEVKITQLAKGQDGPTPGNFKPLLKYDNEGALAEIPYPFMEFNGNAGDAKAWEAGYGSTLSKETKALLVFTTGDPKGDNPKRMYSFGTKGTMVSCAMGVRASLLFEGQSLNENMLILLNKAGYNKVETKEGSLLYSNGTYYLSFSLSQDPSMALIMYLAASKPAGQFVASAKDFPLFLKKNIDKYTDSEIKDYEQKLGLRPTCTPQGQNLEFTATAESQSKGNFYKVVYERTGKNIDIVAYTKSVTNVEMLDQPDKKQWLEANGFTFVKKTDYSGTTLYSYTSKKHGFSLVVAKSTSECIFVFTYDATGGDPGGEDPTPDPNKKREALYLPLFEAFGKPIAANSPIIQLEKNRKFSAEFKVGKPSETPPVQPEIMAIPPFDVEYSRYDGTGKAGISSITYSKTKKDTEDVVTTISIGFNKTWNKTMTSDDALLRTFLQGKGFEFKQQEEIDQMMMKGMLYTYYSAKDKVLASYFIDKSGSSYASSFVTFVQDNSYNSATWQRAKALLKR